MNPILCLALAWAALPASADDFESQRREMAERERRIIYNNDGAEVFLFPAESEITPENVLALRTSALAGSQVDSIFYNASNPSFGLVTHYSEVFDVRGYYEERHRRENRVNASWPLIEQGADSLELIVRFGREHGIEVFLSKRMNDTHDAGRHSPGSPNPTFAPLKARHPEYLVGRHDQRPPHAAWSAVDYTHPEVRELAYRYLEEVCRNYDVDGIELDFFRGPQLFRSVAWGGTATEGERSLMTGLMRRIREMTEREGRRRGRPILVALRAPDSAEYARRIGMDIERWMAEGLVDLFIPAGLFRLNRWEYSVEMARRHGVGVYPSLMDPVWHDWEGRNSIESYRARASNAWKAGADGVYLYNMFDPEHPMLHEIGDPRTLRGTDKLYFVSVRGDTGSANPGRFLANGSDFLVYPVVTPNSPRVLRADRRLELFIDVGEDWEGVERAGPVPRVTLRLRVPGLSEPGGMDTRLNGGLLTGGRLQPPYIEYPVEPARLRLGENRLELAVNEAKTDAFILRRPSPEGGDGVTLTEIDVTVLDSESLRVRMAGEARGTGRIGSFSVRTPDAGEGARVPPGFEQAPNGHYYPAGWRFPGIVPGSPHDEVSGETTTAITLPVDGGKPGDYALELIVQNRPHGGAYHSDRKVVTFSIDKCGQVRIPPAVEDVQLAVSYE